jgi:hypothetical protein
MLSCYGVGSAWEYKLNCHQNLKVSDDDFRR